MTRRTIPRERVSPNHGAEQFLLHRLPRTNLIKGPGD